MQCCVDDRVDLQIFGVSEHQMVDAPGLDEVDLDDGESLGRVDRKALDRMACHREDVTDA